MAAFLRNLTRNFELFCRHVVGYDIDPDALSAAQANAEEVGVEDVMDFVRCDVVDLGTLAEGAHHQHGAGGSSSSAAAERDKEGEAPLASASDAAAHHSAVLVASLPLNPHRGCIRSTNGSSSSSSSAESGTGGSGHAPTAGATAEGVFDTVILNPPFGTRRVGADTAFVRAALRVAGPEGRIYSLHKSSTRAHWVRSAAGWGVGVEVVAQVRFDLPATYAFHTRSSVDIAVDLLRFVKGSGAVAVAARHESIPAFVEPAAAAQEEGGGGGRHAGKHAGGGGGHGGGRRGGSGSGSGTGSGSGRRGRGR